jgi:hypothetical protein
MREMGWTWEDVSKMDGWQVNYSLVALDKLHRIEQRAAKKAMRKRK